MKTLGDELIDYLVVKGLDPVKARAAVYRYRNTYESAGMPLDLSRFTSAGGVATHIGLLISYLKDSEGLTFGSDYSAVAAEGRPRGSFE